MGKTKFREQEIVQLAETAFKFDLSAIHILSLERSLPMAMSIEAQKKETYQAKLNEWGVALQAAVLKSIADLGEEDL